MFVAWFMGFGIGLIFTFLFWHLQVNILTTESLRRIIFQLFVMFIALLTGLRRNFDRLWHGFRRQPHIRNAGLLPQLPTHPQNWTHQGTTRRIFYLLGTPQIHI